MLAARHRAGDGLDPQLARTLQDMNDASFALTFFPLAVLLATFAIVTVQSGALPRWLGWIAAVIAVAFIGGGIAGSADLESEWAGLPMLLFMLWVLAASVVLILRAGELRPVEPALLPSAFERDPATCGLVLCGLDHSLFHFAQVPFLLALAFFGYLAYRVMRGEYDHDVSHPNERKGISDDSGESAPSS